LPAQLKYLKEKLKEIEIEKKAVIVKDADHAFELIKMSNADVVVAVLPQSVLMHIAHRCTRENVLLLRAEMELLHECDPMCQCFSKNTDTWVNGRHYRFRRFMRLKEIKIIEEAL